MDRVEGAEISIAVMPAFTAVGMRWEGTFAEAGAGSIRELQREFKTRVSEIGSMARPDELLGLSYHAYPAGETFVHYTAVEVSGADAVPEGMERIEVPSLACAELRHRKGMDIGRSYRDLYAWIEREGYVPLEGSLTHLEVYPMAQRPEDADPEFTIRIPVKQR